MRGVDKQRRRFVGLLGMAMPAMSLRGAAWAQSDEAAPWRVYEVKTSVEVRAGKGMTRVWLPQPIVEASPFQQVVDTKVNCEGGRTMVHRTPEMGLTILAAEFPAGVPATLNTVQRVRTKDWTVPLGGEGGERTARPREIEVFLQPNEYVPTDGIVRRTAMEITSGAGTDLEKVRAVYEWILAHTYRDPKVRGCGTGSIKPMLETGDLGGKCADLNGLFVGLLRSSGVPARDAYGIRLGATVSDCRCLGTSSEYVEKAQHCRAEVFLAGYGWVPMDPADVRKVMLEEPPGMLARRDPRVEEARRRLFGSWEMNWMAYNYAQDVELPGSRYGRVPFLMYPQAENAEGRLDSLDPASFRYTITSRQRSGPGSSAQMR